MIPILRKVADACIHASARISAVALIFIMLVICADVIGRTQGHPLYGSHDVVTMVMVVVVFGAMPLCDRTGGNISVDLFEKKFSPGMNRVLDIVSSAIGAMFFACVCYATFESAKISKMLNLSTNLLELEKVWFQYSICAFCAVSAFGLTLRFIELSINFGDARRNDEAV